MVGRSDIKVSIPGVLKKRLVADWEAITRNEKVRLCVGLRGGVGAFFLKGVPCPQIMRLPRQPCVKNILSDFLNSKQRKAAQ